MDKASNLYVSGKTRGTAAAGVQQQQVYSSSRCGRLCPAEARERLLQQRVGGFGRGLAHSAAASRALGGLSCFLKFHGRQISWSLGLLRGHVFWVGDFIKLILVLTVYKAPLSTHISTGCYWFSSF